jgi:hypothetical protein
MPLFNKKVYLCFAFVPLLTTTAARAAIINYDAGMPASVLHASLPGQKTAGSSRADELSPNSANEISAPAPASGFERENADIDNLSNVPLLGPISELSIKWLLMGALVALAGLSSGSRGIHESV